MEYFVRLLRIEGLFAIITLLLMCKHTAVGCTVGCTCDSRAIKCMPGISEFPTDVNNITLALYASGSYKQRNSFENISVFLFSSSSLRHLFLTYCQIKNIGNDTFINLPSLRTLDISYNDIGKIDKNKFNGLIMLKVLSISGNSGCQLSLDSFSRMRNLQELYMADMALSTVDKRLFEGITTLQVLDLHGNNIKRLDWTLFDQLPSLQYLDLSSNLISGIPNDTSDGLLKLKTMQLEHNPWHCNCAAYWLTKLPAGMLKPLTCASPEPLRYQLLINIPLLKLKCMPSTASCIQSKYNGEYGQGLTMSCSIQGDPFPDVTWVTPDGIHISYFDYNNDKYKVDENGTVNIKQVGVEDNGLWKVIARNSISHEEATVDVSVVNIPTSPRSTVTIATTSTTSATTTTEIATSTEKTTKVTTLVETTTSTTHKSTTHFRSVVETSTRQTTAKSESDTKSSSSVTTINAIYFMVAAAGGSAFLTSMICSLVFYCKWRREKAGAEEPVEEFFRPVKTPLQSRKKIYSIGQIEDLEGMNFGQV